MRELETRVSTLTSRNMELESAHSTLNQRLEDLTRDMEEQAKTFRNEMARKVSKEDSFVMHLRW